LARRSAAWYVYTGSIALHAVLGIAAIAAPSTKRHQAVAIALAENKKPKKEAKDEKPPPPPPPAPPAARAKSVSAPKPAAPPPPTPAAAPPPAAAPAFADLGLTLGNGGGGPGLAVPQPGAAPAPTHAPAAATATTRKVTTLAPAAEETCDEPPVKPKPRSIVKPAYTEDARAAQVEGVVRVEITIDPTGQVVDAKILRGLGHGLDEAALAAARQMTFEPGTRCGKAHVATISLGVRFALGS
jgi:periplasmic protein TonB